MAVFLTRLRVERYDGGWLLIEPLGYHSDVTGGDIWVPQGFRTDFASTPRVPLAFWLAGDAAHAPSVIHDYLYRNNIGSRSQADAVFYEAMALDGTPGWRRWLMWGAVRTAGWYTWRQGYPGKP